MRPRYKLGNPIFIVALLLLVINDWYLKPTFPSLLTGKLSDFAGLFAIAFFFSAILQRRAVVIHITTAFIFIAWKSPLVQPLIDNLNALGIPAHRTIDYIDYTALLILPLSYLSFKLSCLYTLRPLVLRSLIIFPCLAFVATSLPPGKYTQFTNVNKTYNFSFSKRELVSRINALQLEYVNDISKSIHYNNKLHHGLKNADSSSLDFDSKTNMFYYWSTLNKTKRDTIARILDYETVKDTDVIPLKTSYANITLSGNASTSVITVISLNAYVRKSEKGNVQTKAFKLFEKLVIKKIGK